MSRCIFGEPEANCLYLSLIRRPPPIPRSLLFPLLLFLVFPTFSLFIHLFLSSTSSYSFPASPTSYSYHHPSTFTSFSTVCCSSFRPTVLTFLYTSSFSCSSLLPLLATSPATPSSYPRRYSVPLFVQQSSLSFTSLFSCSSPLLCLVTPLYTPSSYPKCSSFRPTIPLLFFFLLVFPLLLSILLREEVEYPGYPFAPDNI